MEDNILKTYTEALSNKLNAELETSHGENVENLQNKSKEYVENV